VDDDLDDDDDLEVLPKGRGKAGSKMPIKAKNSIGTVTGNSTNKVGGPKGKK